MVRQNPKSENYDVVIIGSGIGALAAASLLSKKMKVAVLEKERSFGGYCGDFTRDGFRFEIAVQSVNGLYARGPIRRILEDAGALEGVKVIKPANLYRSIFPEHDIVVPQGNLDKYLTMLFEMFPMEKDRIADFAALMLSIYKEMKRFYEKRKSAKSPFLVKYHRSSIKSILDEYFMDDALKAIISQYWLYRGLPPSKLSAITFAYIWCDYMAGGSFYPCGGMSKLVGNMTESIIRHGGAVIGESEVTDIVTRHNHVTEVITSEGSAFRAKFFISNIDVLSTFGMIRPGHNSAVGPFVESLIKNALSVSACKIYLGLDDPRGEFSNKEYETFVNPSYDPEAMYQASVSNDFAKAPFSITAYSAVDDTCCGKGRSVISLCCLSDYDLWKKLSKEEYVNKKDQMYEILMGRCEKVMPGIKGAVMTRVEATPLTMERYTGNSKGSVYGWNRKSLAEEIRYMNPATPLNNLFLSSHWTKIGGGVGGVLLSSDRTFGLIDAAYHTSGMEVAS